MKRYIVVALAILIALPLLAQNAKEYRVVRVVGIVEDPGSGKSLKTGDVILSNSKLKFATKDAYIIINSPETGRKKISGVPDNKSREIFQLLQSFVQPDLVSTGSRNISMVYLEALQNSFAYDTILILSPSYIAINTQKLSLQKPAAIKAWYSHNKTISYRKVSDQSFLHLGKKSIFGDSVITRYPRVVIEYFENENEAPGVMPGLLIASFVPVYLNETNLAAEVRALVSGRPGDATYSATVRDVRDYLAAEYANTLEDNLKQWLKEQGILSE